jgi:hypothetical protein
MNVKGGGERYFTMLDATLLYVAQRTPDRGLRTDAASHT